jgi:hypothetical protein
VGIDPDIQGEEMPAPHAGGGEEGEEGEEGGETGNTGVDEERARAEIEKANAAAEAARKKAEGGH